MNYITKPEAIEQESFRIIEEELGPHSFIPEQFRIVQRAIHATGDFDFAKNTVFHPQAILSGIKALREGRNLVVDVEMVRAGINKTNLRKLGVEIKSYVADEDVAREAKALGITRSIVAMRKAAKENPGAVYAIGNAPTALLEIIELTKQGKADPSLIIGVPVGFVSAVESKDLLVQTQIPHIASLGRKGGSSVAVAMVNALMLLALENK